MGCKLAPLDSLGLLTGAHIRASGDLRSDTLWGVPTRCSRERPWLCRPGSRTLQKGIWTLRRRTAAVSLESSVWGGGWLYQVEAKQPSLSFLTELRPVPCVPSVPGW